MVGIHETEGVLKNLDFLVTVHHLKKGEGVGLVRRIILLEKRNSTKKLDSVALVLNYFKKMMMGCLRGHIWLSVFEAYNWVVTRGLVEAVEEY